MRTFRQGAKGKMGLHREGNAAKNEVLVSQIPEAEGLQSEEALAKDSRDYMDIVNYVSKIDALPRRQPRSMSIDGYGRCSDLVLPALAANPQATTNDKLKCDITAIAAVDDDTTTEALLARSGPPPMLPQRPLRKTKNVSGDAVSGVPMLKPSSRDNRGPSSSTSRRQRKSVSGVDKEPGVPNTSTTTKSRIRQRCSRSPIRARRRLCQFGDGSSSGGIQSPGSRLKFLPPAEFSRDHVLCLQDLD